MTIDSRARFTKIFKFYTKRELARRRKISSNRRRGEDEHDRAYFIADRKARYCYLNDYEEWAGERKRERVGKKKRREIAVKIREEGSCGINVAREE